MTPTEPPYMDKIRAANQLIVDASDATIKRIISLADGDCCDINPDGSRIYYRAPEISSIEYIINRALGTPGAKIAVDDRNINNDIEDKLSDIAHELENLKSGSDPLDPDGPLRTVLGSKALLRVEYNHHKTSLEQCVIKFLPTAIERMKELCAGVSVRRESNGKTRTYTLKPNRRAIEHLQKRIQGAATPVMDYVSEGEAQRPDLTRDYTQEQIHQMTTTEIVALLAAAEANEAKGANAPEPVVPEYHSSAYAEMAAYLPTAITHLKTLAQGATTLILDDAGGLREISHHPDPLANQFLINAFIGAPRNTFIVKVADSPEAIPNSAPIARYTETIIRLCTSRAEHSGKTDHIRSIIRQITQPT